MSAALITLFAVSIVGALGMAFYALRVLLGRWDRPQHFRPKPPPMMPAQPQQARPVPPAQYLAPPVPRPMGSPMAMGQQPLVPSGLPSLPPSLPRASMPPASPVWVAPAGSAPAPYVPPFAIATPLPINVRSPGAPAPAAGLGAWTPPLRAPSSRAPSPGPVSGLVPPEAPRLARGSIPPDYAGDPDGLLEDEPDTDPGVPEMVQDEPVVTRGARYSVIRSSRR